MRNGNAQPKLIAAPPTSDPSAAPIALDTLTIRELAHEAQVVEPTMRKRLRGERVRGVAGDRCDRVLRARGIEPGALREAS